MKNTFTVAWQLFVRHYFIVTFLLIYSLVRSYNYGAWYSNWIFSAVVFSALIMFMGKRAEVSNKTKYIERSMTLFSVLILLEVFTIWISTIVDNAFSTTRPLINVYLGSAEAYSDYEVVFQIAVDASLRSFLFATCSSFIFISTKFPVSELKSTPLSFSGLLQNILFLFYLSFIYLGIFYYSFVCESFYGLVISSAIYDVIFIISCYAMGKISYENYYKKFYEPEKHVI